MKKLLGVLLSLSIASYGLATMKWQRYVSIQGIIKEKLEKHGLYSLILKTKNQDNNITDCTDCTVYITGCENPNDSTLRLKDIKVKDKVGIICDFYKEKKGKHTCLTDSCSIYKIDK